MYDGTMTIYKCKNCGHRRLAHYPDKGTTFCVGKYEEVDDTRINVKCDCHKYERGEPDNEEVS